MSFFSVVHRVPVSVIVIEVMTEFCSDSLAMAVDRDIDDCDDGREDCVRCCFQCGRRLVKKSWACDNSELHLFCLGLVLYCIQYLIRSDRNFSDKVFCYFMDDSILSK